MNRSRKAFAIAAFIAFSPAGPALAQGAASVGVPVEEAVARIVPPGYSIQISPKIPRNATLSWLHAGPWRETLDSSARAAGLEAELIETRLGPVVRLSPGGSSEPIRLYDAAPVTEWATYAGSTVRETLEVWSVSQGWTLIWDSPSDPAIRSGGAVKGDLATAASSLVKHHHSLVLSMDSNQRIMQVK